MGKNVENAILFGFLECLCILHKYLILVGEAYIIDVVMTDLHTHILPGIDDGSRELGMTIAMLKEEERQGIRRVVATPHFYASRMSVEDFLLLRRASLDKVVESREYDSAQVQILPGAEVYYFPGMGKADRLPDLCIEGTDQILLEMPFVQWDEAILHELKDILYKQHLQVILAHVERYIGFQRDRRIWNQVMDLPLTIQLNAGGFLKGWSRRRSLLDMVRKHPNVVLGSDCHNMTSRPPNLAEARAVIQKKLGSERLQQIDRCVDALLGGPAQ